MRKLLLLAAVFVVGYIAGVVFGYRSAVVDYVENDAQTIETMADSMYETVDEESLSKAVGEAVAEAQAGDESGESSASAFQ